MSELMVNILGTIIGGVILTFLLFFTNEFFFPKINFTGEWVATIHIKETTYKPFNNLAIEYRIHLLQKGSDISGSGEKIKDIRSDGSETVFDSEKRVFIDISGYYQKKYFHKSRIFLNIIEEGRKRESRSTYFFICHNKNRLTGNFTSTAANAKGAVEMIKL